MVPRFSTVAPATRRHQRFPDQTVMSSALFTPISLKGLTLSNRLVVAPMCQYSAIDGCAGDWHMTHLGALANSGAALVVVEATAVERAGRITHGDLGLYSDDCEAAMKRIVDHCRRIGSSKLGIQIGHAGRKASSQLPWNGGLALRPGEDPWIGVAPSAIALSDDWPTPHALAEEEVGQLCDKFVAAARRAARIGFDSIELHMAHGYLLHSFMSPISNRRSDRYGGSFENRLRFPMEVARAVRAAVPDLPLGARITGSDWMEGGLTTDDAVTIAKTLKDVGLDFVCVSSGAISPKARMKIVPGYQIPFAERVRGATGIVTRAVGLIATPRQAESIVQKGQADLVAIGRSFLDNPHWGWHAAHVLGANIERPPQYLRVAPKVWPGIDYESEETT